MASDGTALTGLWFNGQKYFAEGLTETAAAKTLPVFDETVRWLDIYFSGGFYAAAKFGRNRLPQRSMAAFAANFLRPNHYLRRTCCPACCT